RYAPNMTKDRILAMTIQDPTDTERHNDNMVNGVDVVGDMTPDQMGYFRPFAGWSSYRSPVEGLYMCGGYCHPGGGVHAGAGHNAAGRLAEDYKLPKWWGCVPRREARIAVDASPEALWRFLRDFRSLCTCIPGVERIEPIDDRSADVTVREKVGVI